MCGSRVRRIRKWVRAQTAEALEFSLLLFPTTSWKQLCQICHLRPSDFQLPYFLRVCYGDQPPEGSTVAVARAVTPENLEITLQNNLRLTRFYSFLRTHLSTHRERKQQRELQISDITLMGFSREQAIHSLERGRNAQERVEWLLDNLERVLALPNPEDGGSQEDFSPIAKCLIAQHAPIEEVVWWYHELHCKEVEAVLAERLREGGEMNPNARSSYCKLVEKVMWLQDKGVSFAPLLLPKTEEQLVQLRHKVNQHTGRDNGSVVVLGDASGSMEVAIQCSTILGSLLTATLKADLSFFHEAPFAPSIIPRTAQEAIRVVRETEAKGATSMAAGLWPYYENKRKVDMFVVVSDEGENVLCNGYTFAQLFAKYKMDVAPSAKVLLISFLPPGEEGIIKTRLLELNIPCKQLRLDALKPDTSKFDAVLGMAMMDRDFFAERFELIRNTTNIANTDLVDLITDYL